MWASPISPSISARGTSAATESITRTSTAPLLINTSAISRACSPVSGCDKRSSSTFTPSFFAYSVSSACSASMNAAVPPFFCASAIICNVSVVFPEDSGQTTLTLHIIAEAQKKGGTAAFIDAEHALDTEYAKKLGVKVDELLLSQPDTGEQALEIAEVLIRSGAVDVLVIDSVAALVPRAEIEGEMGDAHMGLQARLMSQALRKLTATISKSKTCMIFINQLRHKIGVMFGNPETTTGGNALKFYSSIRLDIRRTASIKQGQDVIGSRTKVRVVKNKVAPPFKEVEFDLIFGEGISKEGDVLDLAVEGNLVEKSGTWYAYGGQRIGQGRENAKQFVKENPKVLEQMEKEVLENFRIAKAGSVG